MSPEAMEQEVARLNAYWRMVGRPWEMTATGPSPRRPTLFERDRAESRGEESFRAWLERTGQERRGGAR